MLVPPGRQCIVDVYELLRPLVEVEPFLGIAIDLEPGLRDSLGRPLAEIEARAFERCMRRLAEARLIQRRLKRGSLRASLVIVVDEAGLLETQAELDLAELL